MLHVCANEAEGLLALVENIVQIGVGAWVGVGLARSQVQFLIQLGHLLSDCGGLAIFLESVRGNDFQLEAALRA